MKYFNFTGMRALPMLACASLVSLLAACGAPDKGYYDAHGNFVPTTSPHEVQNADSPDPGKTYYHRTGRHGDNRSEYNHRNDFDDNRSDYAQYDRRGYYDRNGYYIPRDGDLAVPENMFPPRGMCRVWFVERSASNQPDVETCNDIQARVPDGAYVIYGG